jgi:large repetitive protein
MALRKAASSVLATAVVAACSLDALEGFSGGDPMPSADGSTEGDAGSVGDSGSMDKEDGGVEGSVPGSLYRDAVLADRPLGYWRFEEEAGATVAADEMEGHPGKYEVPPRLGLSGVAGSHAAGFSKEDLTHVIIADAPRTFAFAARAPMAVEAWASATALGSDQYLLSTEKQEPRSGWSFTIRSYPRGELGGFASPGGTQQTVRFGLSVDVTLMPNTWHHYVFDFDGTTSSFYVDGTRTYTSREFAGALPTGEDRLVFGCRQRSGGVLDGCFSGTLDEVALYDHPLGDGRVRLHWQIGKP